MINSYMAQEQKQAMKVGLEIDTPRVFYASHLFKWKEWKIRFR
jgi:hypothetical protein